MTVVDASVVVKWFAPERHHESAKQLRDDVLTDDELLAPALLPFEVTNALRYSDYYDDEMLTEAATALTAYDFDLVSFADLTSVGAVASELGVSVYDASYIVLAATTDSTIYSADTGLIAAAENASVSATHVRSYT